jgi:nucleoside-diphosphate-sugar epimerase
MEKSRILIIGGTGHIGKHIVTASVRLGHPTAVLTRDSAPSDPAKAQLIKSFVDSGAAIIKVPEIISICYVLLCAIFSFPVC